AKLAAPLGQIGLVREDAEVVVDRDVIDQASAPSRAGVRLAEKTGRDEKLLLGFVRLALAAGARRASAPVVNSVAGAKLSADAVFLRQSLAEIEARQRSVVAVEAAVGIAVPRFKTAEQHEVAASAVIAAFPAVAAATVARAATGVASARRASAG